MGKPLHYNHIRWLIYFEEDVLSYLEIKSEYTKQIVDELLAKKLLEISTIVASKDYIVVTALGKEVIRQLEHSFNQIMNKENTSG